MTPQQQQDKNNNSNINLKTKDSNEIYDRQIRLWGADAQNKISSTKVLYVHLTGVTSEIIKNLVLAGVKADICDGRSYPDAVLHVPTSFFNVTKDIQEIENDNDSNNNKRQKQTVASKLKPCIEELNPLLGECHINEQPIEDITDEYFKQYDIVVASSIGIDQIKRIAKAVTSVGNKFYYVDCFGLEGCAIIDLSSSHKYKKELGKNKLSDELYNVKPYVPMNEILNTKLHKATSRFHKVIPPSTWIKHRCILQYHSLSNGVWPSKVNTDDFVEKIQKWIQDEANDDSSCSNEFLNNELFTQKEQLEKLATTATSQVSPVCAVLGGVIGNEIVKVISGKGEPANNIMLFNGLDGSCQSYLINEK